MESLITYLISPETPPGFEFDSQDPVIPETVENPLQAVKIENAGDPKVESNKLEVDQERQKDDQDALNESKKEDSDVICKEEGEVTSDDPGCSKRKTNDVVWEEYEKRQKHDSGSESDALSMLSEADEPDEKLAGGDVGTDMKVVAGAIPNKEGIVRTPWGILVKAKQYAMCNLGFWYRDLTRHQRQKLTLIKKCRYQYCCILRATENVFLPDCGSRGVQMVSYDYMD